MTHHNRNAFPLRAYRLLRLFAHFFYLLAGASFVYPFIRPERKLALKKRWSYQLIRILGLHLQVLAPDRLPSGALIVSNHISWVDIFAINSVRPSAFISKSEVRHWPLVGRLVAQNDTIFLTRGSRSDAKRVTECIEARLTSGQDVAIFPEGTTSDGRTVQDFHAALLQPAIETNTPLLPLAISYHTPQGEQSFAPAYVGDMSLWTSLKAILAARRTIVRITLTAPIVNTGSLDRRRLSAQAHQAISEALAIHLANNRPE